MAELSLNEIANSGKALKVYVRNTVSMLKRIGERLHHTAALTVYHAAQYGDASHLNAFFEGLRVNDQTALKRWIADNFKYEMADGDEANWISFTAKPGKDGNATNFYVVKGTEPHRKDVYNLDDILAMDSFQNVDVSKPKVYDLNALIAMVITAIDNVDKKADKNDVAVPDGMETILVNTKRDLAKFMLADATPANDDKGAANVKLIGNA